MTQKQAEAAGVGMKPKSKAPEVLKDPAAIVILARRKEKEEKKRQVALLVYERVAEEKKEEDGKRKNEMDDSFEKLDLGPTIKILSQLTTWCPTVPLVLATANSPPRTGTFGLDFKTPVPVQ